MRTSFGRAVPELLSPGFKRVRVYDGVPSFIDLAYTVKTADEKKFLLDRLPPGMSTGTRLKIDKILARVS